MAAVEFDIHQYQWSFIEPPPEDCFCAECKIILKEPQLIECCGIHECRTCVEKKNPGTLTTAICSSCGEVSLHILDKPKQKRILQLNVYCPFQERGCHWSGSIGECDTHLELECQYIDVKCSNGCRESVERRNMTEHSEAICVKRLVPCQHCEETGVYEFITGNHSLNCPEYPLVCPRECGKQYRRKQFEEHTRECPELEVPCDFEFAGCEVCLKRKGMTQHLLDYAQTHAHFQSEFVRRKLEESKDNFECFREQNDQQTLKVTQEVTALIKSDLEQLEKIATEKIDLNKALDEMMEASKQKLNQLYNAQQQDVKQSLARQASLIWEIEPRLLTLETRLSNGQFTEVWKGLHGEDQVAIKKLKPGAMTASNFLEEAQVLNNFKHKHIISLCGVCTNPHYIVMEHMVHGNLIQYFKERGQALKLPEQIDIIGQVASGMAYLEYINCIHRALTSRSILVGTRHRCRIGGFSLARILGKDKTEYTIPQGERAPIKWSAPEVLLENKCSTKSDVWSFGIVQYEVITSKGIRMSTSMAERFIKCGEGIECPPECSVDLYKCILKCWRREPLCRPSFSSIFDEVRNL